jgi:hypothetical protein
MDQRKKLFQVVKLKIKHPGDLVIVTTNKGLSQETPY